MELSLMGLQNPWWHDRKAIAEDEKVKKVLASGEKLTIGLGDRNTVMIGPRQLGKTTALKYDIYKKIEKEGVDPKSILYYSFDTARDYGVISDVILSFLKATSGKRYLYLDEVSFVDEWQRPVKFLLDSPAAKDVRIYVTGSASINLRKELFPGRNITVMEFLPGMFADFVQSFASEDLRKFVKSNRSGDIATVIARSNKAIMHFDELDRLFRIFMLTGGFPLPVFDHFATGSVTESTFDTHWNAFLSDISKAERSVETSTAIIQELIKSYGSKINMSKLARNARIPSHVTAREYMELLKELFIVEYIFPISDRGIPLFRKERKAYFTDPFLFNLFSNRLNIPTAGTEPKVVEGIVHSHLSRMLTGIGYVQKEKETDFVSKGLSIEVKWQENVTKLDIPKSDSTHNIVLSKTTSEGGIIPVAIFLSLLGENGWQYKMA